MNVLNLIWSMSYYAYVYNYLYSSLGFHSPNFALITTVLHFRRVADAVQYVAGIAYSISRSKD